QPIEIARLEFVRVARQRGDIADPVIAGPALEDVMARERRQHRIAAGAAAGDHGAPAIGEAPGGDVPRRVDAIGDIEDTPAAFERSAMGPAIPGAAAVIDIEHGDAAAGPELDAEAEHARGPGGRTAMALDDERRLLARWRRMVGVGRRIEIGEG